MLELEDKSSGNRNAPPSNAESPQHTYYRGQPGYRSHTDEHSDSAGQHGSTSEQDSADEQESPELGKHWRDGLILLFGTYLPLAAIGMLCWGDGAAASGLFFRHPIESIIEYGLALSVPFASYLAWKRLSGDPCRHPVRITVLNGMAIGTSLMVAIGAAVAICLDYPMVDTNGIRHVYTFSAITFVAFSALATAILQSRTLTSLWETSGARLVTSKYTVIGILVSFVAVIASEALPTFMRFSEHLANSDSSDAREGGLAALRALNCERELRMDCAAPMSVGLPGMFLHLDPVAQKQTYFAATGKPFHNVNDTEEEMDTLTDAYLSEHVVGETVKDLSMVRSALTGRLDAETLAANLDWTFVFKNKGFTDQESRAELALPPGAVVSNLTLWQNGAPQVANFGVNDKVAGDYKWIVANHRDPALISDLGRGRVLLQCYPVPAHGEMKVRVSITAPMKLNDLKESSFTLPKLLQKNFAIASSDNAIRIKSTAAISTRRELNQVGLPTGEELCVGKLSEKEISSEPLSLTVPRSNKIGPFATLDRRPGSESPDYIVERIKLENSPCPKKLVVVLDGSVCMQEHWSDIIDTLKALSRSSIPEKELIVANSADDANLETVKLDSAVEKLKKSDFTGGRDNLRALVRASDIAGEHEGGALVWLHGPQPSFNSEMYLMEQFVARPRFYELSVDDQWTNLPEFFKNHKEIGPFLSIPRSGSMAADMSKLVHSWEGGKSYSVQLAHVFSRPDCEIISESSGEAITTLWANERVKQLSAAARIKNAAELASRYRVVTPLTACVVVDHGTSTGTVATKVSSNTLKVSNDTATLEANAVAGQVPTSYEASDMKESADNGRISIGEDAGSPKQSVSESTSTTNNAPTLETNGTVGPQGGDVTYITGVNTAGTVRVNNLANLEALLNIIANGFEIFGLLFGVIYLLKAVYSASSSTGPRGEPGSGYAGRLAVLGLTCIAGGLAAPGFINWMMSSARDANLFS